MSFTLDLPMPPSVNRIWRVRRSGASNGARVYLDPAYDKWRTEAGKFFLMSKRAIRHPLPIAGQFDIEIILDERKRGNSDADNRIKAVNDACQRMGIVTNDKNCRKVSAEWGEAPLGCRITITEVKAPAHDTSLCNDAMRKAAAGQGETAE